MITPIYFKNNLLLPGIRFGDGIETPYELFLHNPKNFHYTEEELYAFCYNDTYGSITGPDLTQDAINIVNRLYYSQPKFAFEPSHGLAKLYHQNTVFLDALCSYLQQKAQNNTVRVAELFFGAKLSSWNYIAKKIPKITIELHAYDLHKIELLDSIPDNLHVTSYAFDSTKSLELKPSTLYDIIIVTYGFDSIWTHDDIHYFISATNKLYTYSYRVKLSPNWNQFDRYYKDLISHSFPSIKLTPELFTHLIIERTAIPTKTELPYSIEHYKDNQSHTFTIPGGFIHAIPILKNYLANEGEIVIGEVGKYTDTQNITIRSAEPTGIGALYHVDDYTIAWKHLREQSNTTVKSYSLSDFANTMLTAGWEEYFTLSEVKAIYNASNNFLARIQFK
jgi:hypothetical protein